MNLPAAVTPRRATAADVPMILSLVNACADAPPWAASVWRDFAAGLKAGESSRLLLLAHGTGGDLCGLLAATSLMGQTELESVLVGPPARRRGVGRALAMGWLQWAEAAGATAALLEVRSSNLAAIALYTSLGFAVQGRRPRYYHAPAEDALLMGRVMGQVMG